MKSVNSANTGTLSEIATVLNQIEDIKRILREIDIVEELVRKSPKKTRRRK